MIRILVPLDGSQASEQALDQALAVSRVFPAQIRLVQVLEAGLVNGRRGISSVDWHAARQRSEAYLRDVAERYSEAAQPSVIDWSLREGDPAEEIVREIDAGDADLLVITRYGKGAAVAFVTGGTAQKIISRTDASVLLIEPKSHASREIEWRNILVAVDGSTRSERALSVASMVARVHSGRLRMLRVISAPRLPAGAPLTEDARRVMQEMQRMIRSEVEKGMRALKSRVPQGLDIASDIVESDDVPGAIDKAARDSRADLLIMAARDGTQQAEWHYDSVCEALLSHTRGPLLVLRSAGAGMSSSRFQSVFSDQLHADAV